MHSQLPRFLVVVVIKTMDVFGAGAKRRVFKTFERVAFCDVWKVPYRFSATDAP